jgi:hypothetical protein
MDIPATLVLITVLILVVAYIIRPFVASRADGQEKPAGHRSASALRQRADLLARRNRIYRALRDLDFDHQTNKVADEEYASQRRTLVAEGVKILQRLDELAALDTSPEADPVEASVLAMRGDGAIPAPAETALHCPQCGAKVKAGDAFCGLCGAGLDMK